MISLAFALLALQQPAYQTGPGAAPQAVAPAPYRTGSPAAAYRVAPEAEEASGEATAPAIPPPQLALTGVTIQAYDRRVESRWGSDDPFYASTIRGGAAIAQSRQGPLDGGWTVASQDGTALFALQLVDSGQGAVEGAWRGAPGTTPGAPRPEASGFIALASREPDRAVLRFLEPGATAPTVITVGPSPDGTWRGEVARGSSAPSPVVMRRR